MQICTPPTHPPPPVSPSPSQRELRGLRPRLGAALSARSRQLDSGNGLVQLQVVRFRAHGPGLHRLRVLALLGAAL
eukprot:3248217-Pyramimonas_sp.AAC.1